MPSMGRHKREQDSCPSFKSSWPTFKFFLPLCPVLLTNLSFSLATFSPSSLLLLSPLHLPPLITLPPPTICPHPPEHGGFQQFPFLGSFPPSPPGSSGRRGSAISPSGGGCCCAPTGEICRMKRVGLLDRVPDFEHLSPLLRAGDSRSPSLSPPSAVSRLFVATRRLLIKPHVKVQAW